MSRKPRMLTEKEIEKAAFLAGIGCNLNQIANILDISPATFDRMIERQEGVSEAISKGRDNAASAVMGTAYQMALSGKVPAMTMFWLKTRMRWAEARDVAPVEDASENTITLNYKV